MNSTGQFFAIDRRVWAEVCSIGRLNMAVAYIVLARGTLGDLRTTSWSVNAIEDRTSVPRLAAKTAIQSLIDEGFIDRKAGGTKPKYYIKKFEDVKYKRSGHPELSLAEKCVLSTVDRNPDGVKLPKSGGIKLGWPEAQPYQTGRTLCRRGILKLLPTGAFVKAENAATPSDQSEWIWLPNSIVDGAAGELPPLERIRQSHHLSALRLFIELYHSQSLSADGGVNWRVVRMAFNKDVLAQYGQFNIIAFWPKFIEGFSKNSLLKRFMTGQMEVTESGKKQDTGWKDFFSSLDILVLSGLMDIIPHVITGDSAEGTVIHPMAQRGQGEEAERELATAATDFGKSMLVKLGMDHDYMDHVIIFPAQRHLVNVSIVGLIRLRHRAKTRATAEWIERMSEWREAAERYRAHESEVLADEVQPLGHATSTGHQR